MSDKPDAQLLRDYAQHGSEAAFRELVTRHTDFVYSAAWRQVESAELAADIAQNVFADLARKARSVAERLAAEASLAGWLHRATRYAALNHLRDTRRQRVNERQAMEQLLTNSESSADWEQIRPSLDEALDSLGDEDREALLLRYFKNQDFRVVGQQLGVSDDAAQKRVSRAVDRLREFFSKRNVTVGASGLAVLISANAVQSAPVGLVAAISTAVLAGTAVSTTTFIAATTKTLAMTALQKTLVTATVAVLAGTGIYEARQASQLRDQTRALLQQQAEQLRQLQLERDDATNRLGVVLAENEQLKSGRDEDELLKLRGEVGTLKAQLATANTDLEQARKQISPMKFDLPYFRRDEWNNKGTRTPMDGLSTMLRTLKTRDETGLQQIVFQKNSNSPLDVQIGISKEDWDTLSAIQIVSSGWSSPIINGHPQVTATIESILERQISLADGTSETERSVHSWFFTKTNGQWLISFAQ